MFRRRHHDACISNNMIDHATMTRSTDTGGPAGRVIILWFGCYQLVQSCACMISHPLISAQVCSGIKISAPFRSVVCTKALGLHRTFEHKRHPSSSSPLQHQRRVPCLSIPVTDTPRLLSAPAFTSHFSSHSSEIWIIFLTCRAPISAPLANRAHCNITSRRSA